MLSSYVAKFMNSDPVHALNYYFQLRNFKAYKNRDLFVNFVSELVLETKEYDLLLGVILPDGSKKVK